VAMSRLGLKVCLLDADMGLANADVLCNITPRLTLEHVVAGKCKLWEAMLLAPGGFRLIPGASGVARMTELGVDDRRRVLQQLAALERVADVLIIDTGAGIGQGVVSFAAAAHTSLIITTPEPTSLTDGYGMIKTLSARGGAPAAVGGIELVVNMAGSIEEARNVYERMDRVSRTFLHRPLSFGGAVPADAAVPAAVRQRVPFVLFAPDGAATNAVRGMARRLAGLEEATAEGSAAEDGRGFFSRLAGWLGGPRR
jgi:flagellar biosynthesis protein FlhG